MGLKYNRQLLIATTMQDKNESDLIINIVNKGISQGMPTQYLYLGNLETDLYRGNKVVTPSFVEDFAREKLLPGTMKFFRDNISNKVIQASKSINGKEFEIIEYKSMEDAKKALSNKLNQAINKLDANSRLYVVGHGGAGEDCFYREQGIIALTYYDLAQLISQNSKLKTKTNSPFLVSLISCSAGVDYGNSMSSACILSKRLAKNGVYAKVSAPNGILQLEPSTWRARKYVSDIHHGEYQKKYFETNPSNQTTWIRYKVYPDNISSILNAVDTLESLRIETKGYEAKLRNGSINSTEMRDYKATRANLASLTYDLVSDRNYVSNIGKENFEALNKIRWEEASDLKSSKIYTFAKETLQKDISYCIFKDPSFTKSLETSFESVQSQLQFYKYLGNDSFGGESYYLSISNRTIFGNLHEQNEKLTNLVDRDTNQLVNEYAKASAKKRMEEIKGLGLNPTELKRDLYKDLCGNVSKIERPEIVSKIHSYCTLGVYNRRDRVHTEFYEAVAKNRALTALQLRKFGVNNHALNKILGEIYEGKQSKSLYKEKVFYHRI